MNDKTDEEKKQWNEEKQWTKIWSVLDDHEETMKGRQKELNSLKEMGAMTIVKRSEAAGKRVIQTRWVDREKDGRVKSRLVLKDCKPMSRGVLSPRCSHQLHRHCL